MAESPVSPSLMLLAKQQRMKNITCISWRLRWSQKAESSSEEISNTIMIPFQVEDRLFRVPSYQFIKESPEFSEMYKLDIRTYDGNPIKLEMVTQEDFRSLLKILYPLWVS